jgi:hypothetical protein
VCLEEYELVKAFAKLPGGFMVLLNTDITPCVFCSLGNMRIGHCAEAAQ